MTTLTASEAAAALGCSRRWLRELAKQGFLVVVEEGGGRGNQATYRLHGYNRKPDMAEAWGKAIKAKEAAK